MRIFLSYAREQKNIAEHIAAALRLEGHWVFFDQHAIAAGEAFNEKIRREIRRSDLLIFLISPDSVAPASYARTELTIAERTWPAPEGKILPVMAERTPWDDVPGILKVLNIIEAGDNVVAEVSFAVDQVRRTQRSRRARVATACSLVVVLSGLAWWLLAPPDTPNGTTTSDATGENATPSTSSNRAEEPSPHSPGVSGDAHGSGRQPSASETDQSASGSSNASERTKSGSSADGRQDESEWRLSPSVTLQMVLVEATEQRDQFWLGQTEVTRAQWLAVMEKAPGSCGEQCGGKYPIDQVGPHEALEFTNHLSRHLGIDECYQRAANGWDWVRKCKGFRIPTEMEWEAAAGTNKLKEDLASPFVDDPIRDYFCKLGNHLIERCDDGFSGLAEVGSFKGNRWGIYDIFGNVAEAVWDNDSGHVRARGGAFNSGPDLRVFIDGNGNRRISKSISLIPFGWKGQGLRVARTAGPAM